MPLTDSANTKVSAHSNSPLHYLLPFPPGGLDILNTFRRMRGPVLVFAHERVRIGPLLQIAQSMIHLSMFRLVRSDVQHQVPDRLLSLRHVPVTNRDFRSECGRKERQIACVDVGNAAGIGYDRFFLEVTDEAMARTRRDEVREEESVEEGSLGSQDLKKEKG